MQSGQSCLQMNLWYSYKVHLVLASEINYMLFVVDDSDCFANTGKTTVISAAVCSRMSSGDPSKQAIWLVAQSNVAVKNIAEKLADDGFLEFKILVSRDFHFDWLVA
jgi:hypothetical protein